METEMATSGSKRTGRLASAKQATSRDTKTGGWSQRSSASGQFAKLKSSNTAFKSVRTER
jgi:hypothetical protein